MRIIYAILCIIGTALPLAQFIPWLADHGLHFPLFIQQAVATPIAAFAWSDLVVSAAVVLVFVLSEGRRLGMRYAWVSLLGLAVGVSLALPLFLLLRERHLASMGPSSLKPNLPRGQALRSRATTGISRTVVALALVAGLTAIWSGPAASQARDCVAGDWLTSDRAAIVRIAPCQQTLCGTLVWLREGDGARDERNPDPSRRAAPLCGLNVFNGFRPGEAGRWTGGAIYGPEAGDAIDGVSLSARGDALTLVVGVGPFAGRETWRRQSAPAQPCRGR